MLIKHSRTIGIICAALNMAPWLYFAAYETYILSLPASAAPFESQGYASLFLPFIIAPMLLVTALGLIGSLLIRRKPTAGLVLMFVSGGLLLPCAYIWWLGIAPLLLIAAGVLAFISANKTSVVKAPPNQNPDSSEEHTPSP